MRGCIAIIISALLLFCAPSAQLPDGLTSDEDNSSTISIAALKSLYVGGSQRLGDVIFISGSITATDHIGEFPNTLILEDDTGAVEVSVDLDEAHNTYKIGYELTINCTDLWIGSSGGALMVGGEPTGDYAVDALDLDTFSSIATVGDVATREPLSVTLSQLSQQLVSCFISISGVQFLQSLDEYGSVIDTFCTLNPDTGRRVSTTHTIEEVATGEQLSLYVASTVIYAADPLPSGSGVIYAILDRYGSSYSVSLVSNGFYFDE